MKFERADTRRDNEKIHLTSCMVSYALKTNFTTLFYSTTLLTEIDSIWSFKRVGIPVKKSGSV